MLRPAIALVALTVLASPPAFAQRAPATPSQRERVIAALERLMHYGVPLHTSHDEGAWLQRAVDAAFASSDRQIQELAQRAATPLVPHFSAPVLSSDAPLSVGITRPVVLTLPRPVEYTAEIFVSVDGGEAFHAGAAPKPGSGMNIPLPDIARAPGLHHVRMQARIVYKGAGVPRSEVRNLHELTYAVYDPSRDYAYDARVFIQSPAGTRANRYSEALPDEPFARWLDAEIARHGKAPYPVHWTPQYCSERTQERGTTPGRRDLCSVAYFSVNGNIGEIWFRTGRVELTDTEVKWLAEAPTFEALKLQGGGATSEYDDLAVLPGLLAMDPSAWPRADVSVAPEDVRIARIGSQVDVVAVVRNSGDVGVRGVQVMVDATVHGKRGFDRTYIVDVPPRGSAEIRTRIPFSAPYGVVVVHAMQISEHGPHDSWHPDPTPQDAVAFRVINPERAPKDYVSSLVAMCGYPCRGY
jgi:hypothetical protein